MEPRCPDWLPAALAFYPIWTDWVVVAFGSPHKIWLLLVAFVVVFVLAAQCLHPICKLHDAKTTLDIAPEPIGGPSS